MVSIDSVISHDQIFGCGIFFNNEERGYPANIKETVWMNEGIELTIILL